MATTEHPTREFCSLCGEVNRVGFHVPDEVWKAVVHPSRVHDIHCLRCFTRRADEKRVQWDLEISFYAVSWVTHTTDRRSPMERDGINVPEQDRRRMDEVVRFLLGLDDLRGLSFGDRSSRGAPFWWRDDLRRCWRNLQESLRGDWGSLRP